jgi:hypothetical protein
MAMLSSPLAAMRPPPCPTGRGWVGYGQDVGESLSRKAASNSFGRSTGAKFNFAELAMASMGKDYFSQPAGPIRGSSPSASLAADLSQNFCIDQRYALDTRVGLLKSAAYSLQSTISNSSQIIIHVRFVHDNESKRYDSFSLTSWHSC